MALAILNGGADPNIFQPRSPQKLIHFVAREVEIRDAQWKHDHHDALRELIAKLEANGDSLDKATEDIRRWSEIGRNYPPLEGRKILDQEMARIRGETEE